MSKLQLPLYDLGTPKPLDASAQVSLQIDGQTIQVDSGTSVMRAAALLGINVPKLCATDSLDAFEQHPGDGHARFDGQVRAPQRRLDIGRRGTDTFSVAVVLLVKAEAFLNFAVEIGVERKPGFLGGTDENTRHVVRHPVRHLQRAAGAVPLVVIALVIFQFDVIGHRE